MIKKLLVTIAALLFVGSVAAADDIDAVFNDATRSFTKRAKAPDKIHYARLKLDSKGQVVSMIIKQGAVTKETQVVTGIFDEKKKKWSAGEPIENGIAADVFKDEGKVVRARMTVDDDNTIRQILVTNPDEKLVMADNDFDAIYKRMGGQTNGTGSVSYVRVELDEKGAVTNTLGLKSSLVTKDTKIAMGKYNEQEKTWEAGEEIPNGLYGDVFKDPGAKTVYLRISFRDDRRPISQILVTRIGEQRNK
jgi:hypothetical protein